MRALLQAPPFSDEKARTAWDLISDLVRLGRISHFEARGLKEGLRGTSSVALITTDDQPVNHPAQEVVAP